MKRTQQIATTCNKTARELTAAQQKAALLIASGQSDEQVGQDIGVDRSTVFRWRKSPTFQAEVNRHRQAINSQVADTFRDSLIGALETLRHLMTHSQNEANRMKAALGLLSIVSPGLAVGPTDPREIIRPSVMQRQADTPNSTDELLMSISGEQPLEQLLQNELESRDKAALE